MVPPSYFPGIMTGICRHLLVVTNSKDMVVERVYGKAIHDDMSAGELQVQQKWPSSFRLGSHVPHPFPDLAGKLLVNFLIQST